MGTVLAKASTVISRSASPSITCWRLATTDGSCSWEIEGHCQEEHSQSEMSEAKYATYQVLPLTNHIVTLFEG